jgi:CMP-2-keto-3-deoxyoctulosonic acid synthetase
MSDYHIPGIINSSQYSLRKHLQQILGSKLVIWVLNKTARNLTLTQTAIQMTAIITIITNKQKTSVLGTAHILRKVLAPRF